MAAMEVFTFDPADPLDKCPGESLRAWRALRDYFYMDKRSLKRLLAKYKENPTQAATRQLKTLKGWNRRFAWQARVEAKEKLIDAELERKWAERQAQAREEDWARGASLRDLAAKIMAESPNFIRTRRKFIPGKIQVINAAGNVLEEGYPAKEITFLALDAYFMLKADLAASQLQRLACGMETAKQVVTRSGSFGFGLTVDLELLDDEQTRDYLGRRARILRALADGLGNP